MATIETVTEHDGGQAVESATAQQAEPPPITAQTIAPEHRHGVHQRSTTLLATVLGAVITALVGGMFLFIVSALDRVSEEVSSLRSEMSEEISSLRSEMNARFVETDRKFDQVNQRFDQVNRRFDQVNQRFDQVNRRFDQVNSVLMDHTDRLARIETTLDINGRPLPSETDDPTGP